MLSLLGLGWNVNLLSRAKFSRAILFTEFAGHCISILTSGLQALQTNECSMAIAGGVNVMTSPALFQNLAAATFLSPTGESKAFDASANGYCRGEGAGLVVLKPLHRAVADGDTVLGVIAGSAVNQGSNCTPITVPVSQSQNSLYRQALLASGADPTEVSYVEAHGTGEFIIRTSRLKCLPHPLQGLP